MAAVLFIIHKYPLGDGPQVCFPSTQPLTLAVTALPVPSPGSITTIRGQHVYCCSGCYATGDPVLQLSLPLVLCVALPSGTPFPSDQFLCLFMLWNLVNDFCGSWRRARGWHTRKRWTPGLIVYFIEHLIEFYGSSVNSLTAKPQYVCTPSTA